MSNRKLVLLGLLVTACLGIAVVGCGSSNSITQPVPNEQPIPVPDGLNSSFDAASGFVGLHWNASSSPNVVGYNVYLYSPSPDRSNSYVKLTPNAVTGTSLVSDFASAGGDFCVTSVNNLGKESSFSAPFHVAPYTGPEDQVVSK